jgi:hypothetical protein
VLRNRLETGQFHSQYLTLVIVETLVKNCGSRVHRAIASERFMSQMKAVVKVRAARPRPGGCFGVQIPCVLQDSDKRRGRDAMEVYVKALELIQHWGEEFLTRQEGVELFVRTYHELRAKGVGRCGGVVRLCCVGGYGHM